MDFATLYDEDIETWAETQTAALRRLAREPGPWSNLIDWENVIEEIEDLGSNQRRAVESLLENAFAHALKVAADPDSLCSDHWRMEVRTFLDQARTKMTGSMRGRIDLDKIWRNACAQASNALDAFGIRLPDVPGDCPCSFDDIINDRISSFMHLGLFTKNQEQ